MLDGDLVRRLDVGQACYVYRGGVTFLQVKRLTGRQAEIGQRDGRALAGRRGAGRGRGVPGVPGGAASARPGGAVTGAARRGRSTVPGPVRPAVPVPGPALPDVSELLDEAFGERRG